MINVSGTVADGFEHVRDELVAALVGQTADPGAQLVVYQAGRQVVDLWTGNEVTGDSLTVQYSSAKGAAHLVVALLVQDGVLELDRAVASYWPEFAAEGKGELTLRDLLTHRAGLIGVDGGFTVEELADDRRLAARLAPQRPHWKPGSAYGYHAFVISALTGEVVRRVTGQTIQELFEERVRAPYDLDYYLGLPDELEARYLEVQPMQLTPAQQAELAANAPAPDGLTGIAFNLNADPPTDLVAFANSRPVRAQGPASSGGVGNARGLARMYAAAISTVDGRPPLLNSATIAEFGRTHSTGTDLVTGDEDHFALGFEAKSVRYPALSPGAFGHMGASGAESLADPRTGIAYSYTRRRFAFPGGAAPENDRLITAVVHSAQSVQTPKARQRR